MAEPALMTVNGKPALAEAEITTLSRRLQEPETVRAIRWGFLASYQAQALPDRVQHLWRYTDPRQLLPDTLTVTDPLPGGGAGAAPEANPETNQETAGLVIRVAPGEVSQPNRAATQAGIVIRPLAEAAEELAWLGRMVPGDHGLFEALNGAAWNMGVLVKLPRGKELTEPLRIVVPAACLVNLPRLLIVADDGAAGTVVEEHVGGGAQNRVIGVTELHVGANASVHHVLLQQWGPGVKAHLTTRGHIERDGRLFTAVASFGGTVAKLDLGAVMAGSGARSELVGVALAEGRQHLDHHTEHRHLAGHTWSNLDFKVALAGRARSVYTGLIRIETNAPHSEAYQENRNLLLAEKCRADTIPELEILTDEVSCTHGATAAPVDPEQLFYLESRGISYPDALRLVVRGFLEETLRRIPAELQGGIEQLVHERLDRLAGGDR